MSRDPDAGDAGDDGNRHPENAKRSIRHEIAQMFGEPESRLDQLSAADAALPELPAEPKPRTGFILVAPLVILVGLVGLAARIVVMPFRGLVRRRAARAEAARLDADRLYLREVYDKLVSQPDHAELRINLAVMLASYNPEVAERELDHVVCTTPETAKPHAVALHNRGIVRMGMQLSRLARADTERAKQLGFTHETAPVWPGFLWSVFKLTAGLQADR